MIEFREFQKIPRLNRPVIVTEKLDGTNACVVISDDAQVAAQSRSRIITPTEDNHGFARWVEAHREELLTLGPGYHYGEWWGLGIQRGYGLAEKRFSLFNVSRWSDAGGLRPACCHVVPVVAEGIGFGLVATALDLLRDTGSFAAPGFMKPEGVVAFHAQGQLFFKATIEKDQEWKGKAVQESAVVA